MKYRFAILFASLWFSNSAISSIRLDGTRLIYNSSASDVSINVNNESQQEVLVQSWLDNGNRNDLPPFALSPPLAKVAAQQKQVLRIFYQGEGLPSDRESVFWLNVQEIPQAAKEANVLQLAVRQRIKVFFRPSALENKEAVIKAPLALKGNVDDDMIVISNNSPYHINLVSLQQGTKKIKGEMLLPQQSVKIPAPGFKRTGDITFDIVNDYGAKKSIKAKVTSGLFGAGEYVNK